MKRTTLGRREHLLSAVTGVAAVENGTELRVDVGSVNGRVFINNASIGF